MNFTVKLLRVMKLTAILLLAFAMHVSAKSWSQTVTFSGNNVGLEKVFTAIEKQTGYVVFYDYRQISNAKLLTLNVKNEPLVSFLKLCFREQPFGYAIEDKTIVITKLKAPVNSVTTVPAEDIAPPLIDVKGKVVDEEGKPVIATIQVKGDKTKGATTNERGEFEIKGLDDNVTLIISGVSIETFEVKVGGRTDLAVISAKSRVTALGDVQVTVNTGYQQIPKERSNGSFAFIDSSLINRRVTTSILDRLDGVTSGVIFNRNRTAATDVNQSDISIRGRSTLFANPNPLIILDNFPYDGDFSTINPNDIESITILKDAAAASIWGARSGNGVIVITTKKGKFNQPVKVSATANFTVGKKPDLYYNPRLSSSDLIDIELFLNSKGQYNSVLNNTSRQAISPVLEIIAKRRNGQISASDSASQIDALRKVDTRSDIEKYFYQPSVFQQYMVSLTGGGNANQYYFSMGYDKNTPNSTFNTFSRYSIAFQQTIKALKERFEFSPNFRFSQTDTRTNNTGIGGFANGYSDLVDNTGNPLPVGSRIRLPFADTVGQGRLLDWRYYPYNEIRLPDNRNTNLDYQLRLSVKYKVMDMLEISAIYQYSNGQNRINNLNPVGVHATNDRINQFTQLNYSSGVIVRPIPIGGIMTTSQSDYRSHQGRLAMTFNKTFNNIHAVTALAGYEFRDYQTNISTQTLLGYNSETKTYATNIDYANQYTNFLTGTLQSISNTPSMVQNTNHFLSLFLNIGYHFKNKHSLNLSARKDEANIFGNDVNNKGVPLWSAGYGWDIAKEKFYKFKPLSKLKLRLTYGYNGNLDLNAVSKLAITYSSVNNNRGTPYSVITNNPNALLSWETSSVTNIALDFATQKNFLSGSIEYFIKNGSNLLGNGVISPQTGLPFIYANIANMRTAGIDVSIRAQANIGSKIKWTGLFMFSKIKEEVTDYKLRQPTISTYISGNTFQLTPLVGYPLYSLFSYRFSGLDSIGNPYFIVDGKKSQSYATIPSSSDISNMSYNGPAFPTTFGNLLNSFQLNNKFSLSFNITYKLGYSFRRQSIDYNSFSTVAGFLGHPDFHKRWKKPGDELHTNIPAFIYPFNGNRNIVWNYSDFLIEPGGHIRLQDINLTYSFKLNKPGLRNVGVSVYTILNNLGLLWRANKHGIDPDFANNSMPNPLNMVFGAKFDF